jgi:hypothetical protein
MNSVKTASHGPVAIVMKSTVVVALAASAIFACLVLSPQTGKSEAAIQMNLPESLDGYTGEDQPVSEAEKKILPGDTEFAKKVYSNGSSNTINCQIVLAGGEKRSIHRPEICLPAQGWVLKSSTVVPVSIPGHKPLDVMKLTISRPISTPDGGTRELKSLFYYWFVGKNTTTPHHVVRILKTNFDLLFHNTNHRWAYVVVSAPVLEGFTPDGKSEVDTEKTLTTFIGDLAPHLMDLKSL